MAKVTSAERVNPITRANYTGNPNDEVVDIAHDPLAALANLVGNIETDAANSTEPVASEVKFDLESELIKDFHTADAVDNSQNVDFSDIENELSMALGTHVPINAGVGEVPLQEFENQPSQPYQHVEPVQQEPVLQSFESLQTAFGVSPEINGQVPVQPEPVIDPADLAIEEQLLHELSIDPAPVYSQTEPFDAAYDNFVEPVEQFSAPVSDFDPVPTENAYQYAETAGSNIELNSTANEGLTAEFEAAMAGSAADLFGEPQNINAVGVEMAEVAEFVEENNPFGTLAEAVTMPPVSTPFDHQVDDALNNILTEVPEPEVELGWSGELAGELEHIVSSTAVSKDEDFAAEPQVAEVHYDTVSNDFFTKDPVASQVANEAGVFQNDPTDSVEFSAFERELADQLNPNINDDPLVAIPEAPELMETEGQNRRGFGVAAGVLGVAAVVAAGAFGWNYFSDEKVGGPVPVIMASTEPVKIKPKEPGGVEVPNQDQVVFEQVNGNSENKTSQERLASGAETPIRVVTISSVPPVVLPLPVVSSDLAAAKSTARLSPNDTVLVRTEQAIISPRKVRTVVVRPDGTIVAAKPSVLPAKIAKATKTVEPVRIASVEKETSFTLPATKVAARSTVHKTPPVVAALSTAAAPNPIPVQKIEIVPVEPVNRGIDKLRTISTPVERTAPKPVAIVPVKKVKTRPIKKVIAPKKVKPASKPVKLATASTGGYVMQISSQRSAKAAQSSYSRLSKRFSSILGGKGVDIRRFKLKDKGIYYRVRIPAGSKKTAINLCIRYKSAGGSCFVTR